MRSLVLVVVVLSLFAGFSSVQAEEIPAGMLAQMGLSGMQQMSDEEGAQVRGEGFAGTLGFGGAFASVILSSATNTDSHVGISAIPNALSVGDATSQAQAQIGIELSIPNVGSASLSLISVALSAGSSYAFAR